MMELFSESAGLFASASDRDKVIRRIRYSGMDHFIASAEHENVTKTTAHFPFKPLRFFSQAPLSQKAGDPENGNSIVGQILF